jgi:hypothetical protein
MHHDKIATTTTASGQPPRPTDRIGPILFLRETTSERLHLGALFVVPSGKKPPVVQVSGQTIAKTCLYRQHETEVLRYDFALPLEQGGEYAVDGDLFQVVGVPASDLQLAYVSCNGQEHGDYERPTQERNAMWRRLAEQHATTPLSLLLHGGDQLYADEMLRTHSLLESWSGGRSEGLSPDANVAEVEASLRDYLFRCYSHLYQQPDPAYLLAHVPSLCMWDDHDICDGWGSLPADRLDSPVGRTVFRVAREFFLLFQMGTAPDALPAILADRDGSTLTWHVDLPGLDVVALDLRSERRPDRVLGEAGWKAARDVFESARQPRVLLMSSVPLLGPRLSLVETAMRLLPGLQKYEDDLRDQWQSHAHREEWRRMLRQVLDLHQSKQSTVTVLSGEIHLATRGTMAARTQPVHQLIASGIAHPPPTPWYGRILGSLARLGEAPLEEHPIALHPLPGRTETYTSQRNFLMLARRDRQWVAWWELEDSGATETLAL